MTLEGYIFLGFSFLMSIIIPLLYGKRSIVPLHILVVFLFILVMSTSPDPEYEGGPQSIAILIFLIVLNSVLLPFALASSYFGKKYGLNKFNRPKPQPHTVV
jgi:hypothetical protein